MTYIYTLSDGYEIRYVGKTKYPNKRFTSHINECKNKKTYKEKWINKVLTNNGKIVFEILEICDDSISDEVEIYWIHQLKSWGFKLVNLTKGGDGGSPMLGKNHTKETKIKMSEAQKKVNRVYKPWNKGLKMSEDFRKKISDSNKNKKISEETKRKISESRKGIKRGPLSDEVKLKMIGLFS